MYEIKDEKFFKEISYPFMTHNRGMLFDWDTDSQSIIPRRIQGPYLRRAEVTVLVKGLQNYLENPISEDRAIEYKNWKLEVVWLLDNGNDPKDIPPFSPKEREENRK